ncbi:MAG: S8 family serine peptidase, partial [Chloroflexota bacterium]
MKLKLGKWALSILAALILLIPPAPVLSGSPTNSPPGVEGAQVEEIPVKRISQVTLITGDVVTVTANDDGQRSFAVTPANPNQLGQHFLTINQGKDTYIIPDGIDLKKLDMELFNIDYLIDEEYDEEPSLPLLVSYTPKLTKSQAQSLQGKVTALGKGTKLHESVHTLSTRFNYTDIAASYSNLIKQPEVKKIWLNKKVHVKLDDSVPLVGAPWWWSNMGNQGEGMEIAILDTGIDSTHPALDDLDDDPVTTDPKVIVNQNFTDDTGYDDLYGHGTHCAGIAAGTAAGTVYEGMAPKAYLWNVKVLNRYGSGYEDWVIDGIEFASLGPDGTPQTGDEADIISMSLGDGVTDGTDPASQAVNLAVERGVVVVVAAGNYGSSPYTITTPGTADKAFTIAATDKWDDMAYFSSRGPTLAGKLKPDIAAPGVDIVSSVPTGSCPLCDPSGYRSLQGTSMATPHVAGAAALVKQHFGTTATPQFVKDALMSTALDVGHTVYEQGSGRLNLSWDPLPAVWITPATLSLGPYTQEPTCSAIFTFFTTDNVSSHDVSLSVELVDTTGNDYSDNITLNQDTFTIPSGGQVDVNLTIDLTTLPLSRYDGRLTATVDGGTSGEIHAIFGFRKSVTVTVHKIDISGNPAQNHYLYIFPEGMESKPITGYTDDSGNFTFDAFDSTYHVLSRSTDAVNDATIWTIAEDINVIEDPLIELDERNTGVVDFDPNDELEQKPAGKSSNVVLNFDQYAWSFSDSWYYPATFITRVSPCSNCNIGFNYTCYPLADFKPYSPELVNSSDWYNLSYPATGITGDVTFFADHANLVHRETSYCLPLHEERARWYQYCYDNMFYFGTYSYFMDAPQQRWEWLSPNVSYYLYYNRYMSVTGNCWRFAGISTRYTAAGEYSWAIGCHPFSSGIDYAYISWNEPDNYLGIGGNIFRDSYDQDFYNNCAGQPPGHITITQDGNPVVDEDRWDFFSRGFYFSGQPHFTVEVTGQITVDPKGQTKQELSGSSYTRLDFDAVTTHSDYLPPQLLFRVPGIDPYGAVHGGNITVKVQATDSSSVSSLALFSSSDDGNTWQPATLTGISGGWYTFDLGLLQDCFVSLAAEAEDSHGNHIYHRTMSAFYVGTATAQKIIGAEDATITAAAGSGYLVLGRFAASASSTVSQLRIKCSGPGYVKVAMYSDS